MKVKKLSLNWKQDSTPEKHSYQSFSSVCKSVLDYKEFSDLDDQERRIHQYLESEGIHIVNV